MIDWPSYNDSLVRRGQVLLDFDVLDGWDNELFQMNHGKDDERTKPNLDTIAFTRAHHDS